MTATKTRTRVSREAYFQAAAELLAEDGYPGLKLATLCRRLGVTTGSFYHHFGGWPAFVDALLDDWETAQTERVLRLARAAPDAAARVRTMKELAATTVPHAAEYAIRVWSGDDPQVRAAQDRLDALRIAAVAEIIGELVPDPAVAKRLAVMAMSLMVGWQQLRPPRPASELAGLLDEFEQTVLRHASA